MDETVDKNIMAVAQGMIITALENIPSRLECEETLSVILRNLVEYGAKRVYKNEH